MIGVTFGDKHSYDDFGLILTDIANVPPLPQTETVTVVGRNGLLDLTDALLDEPKYGNRTITYTFQMEHDVSTWAYTYSTVQNYLHGRKLRIIQDDDASYYYYGRCTVSSYVATMRLGTLIITCDCDPYKIDLNSITETDGWLWDPFSFIDGVIYNYGESISVDGETTVVCISKAMPVTPTITCSAAMTVTFEDVEYDLEEGENTIADIRFSEGENTLVFSGSGTVTISYAGGSL